MALRNSPQRPPAAQTDAPQQQAQHQHQPTVELPETVPVLEDATGLEEMPADEPVLTVAPVPNPTSGHALVVVPAAPDAPRAMPLQDRSNTSDRQRGGCDSSGKLKPSADGIRPDTPKHSSSSPGVVVVPAGQRAVCDKENEPSAATGTGEGGGRASIETTSSGGVLGQAQAQQRAQEQQKPPERPPSPVCNAAQPARPAVAPASPPAATRMRMRFEARLRAQAGKPHPLSVRTGPESPPPIPLGWAAGFGLGWPPLLGGPFPLGLPLMQQSYGHAAMHQHWRSGAGLAPAPGAGLAGFPCGTAAAASAAGYQHQTAPPQYQQQHMSDLDCSEHLDWESGEQARRNQQQQQQPEELAAAVHLGMPPIRTQHGQQDQKQQSRSAVPIPQWMHSGSPVAAAQSLALAHQLLLHHHHQQMLRDMQQQQQHSPSPPSATGLSCYQQLLASARAAAAVSSPTGNRNRAEMTAAPRSHHASPYAHRQQPGAAVGSTTRQLVAVQAQRRERERLSGAASAGAGSPRGASAHVCAMDTDDLENSNPHQQNSKGGLLPGEPRFAMEPPEGSPSAKRRRSFATAKVAASGTRGNVSYSGAADAMEVDEVGSPGS
ncbi:hypothetical protein HXX76_015279 [Chlamydomonas incerta]|uniref:Uncharacterized protein n=1 Tax=Chlamydomonas incerta TaxID=51695 RepID=A0A835SA56_CHLIN|nr:hypothetical protein HXX76_015279 [Chlamydomonas incerta]|eukprot:KAG2423532.1 hypothetical protein HXX76_015279 [Chlamydomonas incerta]